MAFEFVFKLSRWPITGVKSLVKKKKNAPAWLENALQTTLRCRSFLNNRDVFLWKGCCIADGCVATSFFFWDIDKVYSQFGNVWLLFKNEMSFIMKVVWYVAWKNIARPHCWTAGTIFTLCNCDSFIPIFEIVKLCRMKNSVVKINVMFQINLKNFK